MNRRLWAALAVAILAGCAGISGRAAAGEPPAYLLKPGDQAPDFTLKSPDGRSVRLAEVAREKTVLLVFFFLGSDFCRWELPHLQRSYEQFRGEGLEVLAVGVGQRDSAGAIERYWKANGLTMPVVVNGTGAADAFKKFRGVNCPTHYLIGKGGLIRARWTGFPREAGPERLRKELAGAGFPVPAKR